MSTKPCIECGLQCEILPVQLGDAFTLTYLRVCGSECLFIVAYEYLYQIGRHKDFRIHLYEKQHEEDKKLRDDFISITTDLFLEYHREHFKANPEILSTPCPDLIAEMFGNAPVFPCMSGETIRCVRASKEDRMKWHEQHVARLSSDLEDAMRELELLKHE